MRVLLALVLVLYGQSASAACSTPALQGNWTYSQEGMVCTFDINASGDGLGECHFSATNNTSSFVGDFSLTTACALTMTLNHPGSPTVYKTVGRSDGWVVMAIGVSGGHAPFIFIRN